MKLVKMRYLLLLTVSILVFHFGPFSLLTAQDLISQLYDTGMRYYAGRDYSRAADYLGQVCDMDQENHVARYYLISSYAAIKDIEKAMKHARILQKKNPGNEQYGILYQQVLESWKQQEQERKAAYRSLTGPQEVVTGGYQPQSSSEPRQPSASPATETAPRVVQPLTELDQATQALDHDEFATASAILEAIVSKNPKNRKALHLLGVVAFNQKKYPDAGRWFEKALEVDPKSFESLFLLGQAFMLEARFEDAEKIFLRAVAEKRDIFALLRLADAQRRQGKTLESEKLFQEILGKDENIAEARLALAESKIEQGLNDEASREVNRVLVGDPANPQAHYVKARILFASELFTDAAQEVSLSLKSSPANEAYLAFLARCHLKGFQVAQALDTANLLLKKNPGSTEARMILAEGLLLEGQTDDAQAHLDEARRSGNDPGLYRLEAQVAIKRGNREQAGELLQKHLAHNSGNGSAYLEYAKFLEDSGDISAALEVYKKVEAQFPNSRFDSIAKTLIQALANKPSGPPPPAIPLATPPPPPSSKTPPVPGKVKF